MTSVAVAIPSNRVRKCLWVMAVALVASQAFAADKVFEGEYARAQKNAGSKAGIAYDNALGASMERAPGFKEAFNKCIKRHPGKQTVRGYFKFTTASSYRVSLQPKSAFSACVTKALEGRLLPAPPHLPYFNPFHVVPSPR